MGAKPDNTGGSREDMAASRDEVGAATGWEDRLSPSLDEMTAMAEAALRALPEPFAALAGEVVCRVADFPDDETLDAMGFESEFDLLGLFRGTATTLDPATLQEPNAVWLFRRPILDYWAEHEEALGAIVAHVLIHELGHHLGLSDEDMEAIERAAG